MLARTAIFGRLSVSNPRCAMIDFFLRKEVMPINRKKMDALKKQYGARKAKDVYYALENKAKASKKK